VSSSFEAAKANIPARAQPPHPMDRKWLMQVDGKEYGPFTGHELRDFASDGRLDEECLVKRTDGASWISARSDATLAAFFNRAPLCPLPKAPRRPGT
jgi:hypothetical protein